MPGKILSANVSAIVELNEEEIASCGTIILAIPTQSARSVLDIIKPFVSAAHLMIFVNKGIENGSLMLPNQIADEVLGEIIGHRAVFLSGPSFASEVVDRQPTCVSVASKDKDRALQTQALFHAPHFRVYDSSDTIGVEV